MKSIYYKLNPRTGLVRGGMEEPFNKELAVWGFELKE